MKTLTIPLQLANDAADALFHLERFTEQTETIATTLQAMGLPLLASAQIKLLLQLHASLKSEEARIACYELYGAVEEAQEGQA